MARPVLFAAPRLFDWQPLENLRASQQTSSRKGAAHGVNADGTATAGE